MTEHVALMDFEGNPNIGLFMFVNDSFALLGKTVPKEKKEEIEKILQVPVYQISVLQTDLVGVFLSGNNSMIISPELPEYEQKELESICLKHNVTFISISHNLNTFGNSLCVGEKHILCSKEYGKQFKKELEEKTSLLVVPVVKEAYNSIGGLSVHANKKYFLSQELEEKDVKDIVAEVGGVGTINGGSEFVSSGVVANSNGILIGSMSTTIEIQAVLEALNFI
jgi:translation initiation factor 6